MRLVCGDGPAHLKSMNLVIAAVLAVLATTAAQSPEDVARPAGPAIPPATIDDRLEVSGNSIAARQIRTRLFVPVTVDGQGPFRFLVDSGADRSVIGRELARTLGLPAGPSAIVQGMAGASRVETVTLDRLKVGANEITDIVAPALAEHDLGAQGLLGIDALAGQRLMLDFEAKTMTVQDARRPEPVEPGEIVVTARRRRGQLILTEVRVANQRIYAVIDTGSEVTIGNSALRAQVFRGRHAAPTQTIVLASVTGLTITADMFVLPRVRLGGVTLYNVPVAFADVPPFALFGLDRQPAMLLGTDVLEAFRRVALDFRNRKIRFVVRR